MSPCGFPADVEAKLLGTDRKTGALCTDVESSVVQSSRTDPCRMDIKGPSHRCEPHTRTPRGPSIRQGVEASVAHGRVCSQSGSQEIERVGEDAPAGETGVMELARADHRSGRLGRLLRTTGSQALVVAAACEGAEFTGRRGAPSRLGASMPGSLTTVEWEAH
ncbi:unnamed protein product [Lampetra fluviatilis]